ncbi:hypothetical protein C0993_010144, partial [Termitomyces sp. T159_Od127]
LEGIWVQPGDRLSIRVNPAYTTIPLPRAIHSEKDSEDVFLALYLYPSLSLLGFLTAKEKLEKKDPSMKYTNNDIMEYKENKAFDYRFYAASFGGANNIADIGVYVLGSNDKASLQLPIEMKTPAVFPEALLSLVSPRISTTTHRETISEMTEDDFKRIQGWAIEFKWPEKGQTLGHRASMKHSKVISQVWNQMVAHEQSGHLYISSPYYLADGVMDILIWTLKAVGYIKRDIEVPPVRDDWWKEVKESVSEASSDEEKVTLPGINMRTVPHKALRVYKKREARNRNKQLRTKE